MTQRRCLQTQFFYQVHFILPVWFSIGEEDVVKPFDRLFAVWKGCIPCINSVAFARYKTPIDSADVFSFQQSSCWWFSLFSLSMCTIESTFFFLDWGSSYINDFLPNITRKLLTKEPKADCNYLECKQTLFLSGEGYETVVSHPNFTLGIETGISRTKCRDIL